MHEHVEIGRYLPNIFIKTETLIFKYPINAAKQSIIYDEISAP